MTGRGKIRYENLAFIVLVCLLPLAASSPQEAPKLTEGLGAIQGVVVDRDGRPIPHLIVYADLTDSPGRGRKPSTFADEKGRFLLGTLKPGNYMIHAYDVESGYPDTFFAFFGSPGAVPQVEVHEGKVTRDVVVRLGPKGGWLSGEVVDAISRAPLVKADILLTRQGDPKRFISTGPNLPGATYRFLVPSNALFMMKVSAPGYRAWFSGGDGTEAHAAPISIKPGETKELIIKLNPLTPNP